MLPNPKNNKKNNNAFSNLSQTPIDEALENQKKIQSKRRSIIIALILTTGFSFIFWSIKSIEQLIKNPPRFNLNLISKLPKFTFTKPIQRQLPSSSNLSKYLEKSPINWSIFVSLDSNYSVPIFEFQSESLKVNDNLTQITNQLNSINPSSQSLINSILPQGLHFQEKINNSTNVSYQGLVNLPKNKILILINQNNSVDSSLIQTELPILIDHLYWYAVSFLN